ncbi:DNA-directed RNA polymerase I subunit rpa49 [Microbotryomycetes sp. JL221]|nr:DNA-directed RNA polymerase I subunit rpa49 [Microbotryomycetes sp. JL221]
MSDPSAHKRRKGSHGQSINVNVVKPDSSTSSPALAAVFPSAKPPNSTAFSTYTKPSLNLKRQAPTVLVAETRDMEYDSRNHQRGDQEDDEDPSRDATEASGYSVEYMIGLHDKRNNTLTLHSAPLHTFTPTVKLLKRSTTDPTHSTPQTMLFTQQKQALGSTFGTKKAIRQLNIQQRNKLDTDSFGIGTTSTSLQTHLQSSIANNSSTLPTLDSITHEANLARATNPKPNLQATKPDQVYNIEDVVTRQELDSIELKPKVLQNMNSFKQLQSCLAFKRSKFLTNQLKQIWSTKPDVTEEWNISNKDQYKLKLVIHVSQLLAMRQAVQGGKQSSLERTRLLQKLGGGRDQEDDDEENNLQVTTMTIVDNLIERYSEQSKQGSTTKRTFTTTSEMKLLGYMFVLILKLDNWSTDVTTIANDLGMGSKKVGEIFRSLGCKLLIPSSTDVEVLVSKKLASTKSEAKKLKQAVLKVPLEFPTVTRGPAKR